MCINNINSKYSSREMKQVSNLLLSQSVVDTYALHFENQKDVHAFLRVLELDIDKSPQDLKYIQDLIEQVRHYLVEFLNYEIPNILQRIGIIDLILFCSTNDIKHSFVEGLSAGTIRDYKQKAGILLKVLHILFHVKARELKYRLPVSSSDLAMLLSHKVQKFVDDLSIHYTDIKLVEYEGGEKSLTSILSKLLFKKETHAAEIHDRIRFRFIVEENDQILPLIIILMKELFPYNYVVPGSCVNTILDMPLSTKDEKVNLFSSQDYNVLNFVADVPIRVPDTVIKGEQRLKDLGATIFHLVEFQIFDLNSYVTNKKGNSAHSLYKERQIEMIKERLEGTRI